MAFYREKTIYILFEGRDRGFKTKLIFCANSFDRFVKLHVEKI